MSERLTTSSEQANSSPKKAEALLTLAHLSNQLDPDNTQHLRQTSAPNEQKRESLSPLKNFYDSVQNPLSDDSTMQSIIDVYSRHGAGNIYGPLQRVGADNKEIGKINHEDKQQFAQSMYGIWRKSLADMTEQDFLAATQSGTLSSNFRKLRNFVGSHPECKTNEDLAAAISQIPDKEQAAEITELARRYNWDGAHDPYSGWTHIMSYDVHARQEDKRIKAEHRLYLNTDSSSTYATINALVKNYESANVPYYFKFADMASRSDTIVIYTSTENLTKNLDIVRQLKIEHPELAKHFHAPPILTGKIDSDIGYGSESRGQRDSYGSIRAKLIQSALSEVTTDWVAQHQNSTTIKTTAGEMPLSDYVAIRQVDELGKTWNNIFQFAKQDSGFTQEDMMKDSKLFKAVKEKIIKNFSSSIQALQASKKTGLVIEKTKTGKQFQITDESLKGAIARLAPVAAKHDPSYLPTLRKKIAEKCTTKGIDPNKFAFDTVTIKQMKRQSHADHQASA